MLPIHSMNHLGYVLNTYMSTKQMYTCTISSYHIVKRILSAFHLVILVYCTSPRTHPPMIAVINDVLYYSDYFLLIFTLINNDHIKILLILVL